MVSEFLLFSMQPGLSYSFLSSTSSRAALGNGVLQDKFGMLKSKIKVPLIKGKLRDKKKGIKGLKWDGNKGIKIKSK